jgi:hypothetical protein
MHCLANDILYNAGSQKKLVVCVEDENSGYVQGMPTL